MRTATRPVTLITMKRIHIDFNRSDKYGHWWFEIGDPLDPDSESYGWWPSGRATLTGTLFGMGGELNGQTTFRGTPTQDPHHGDQADEVFHPIVPADDPRSDEEVAECLRGFAREYHGEWRWTFEFGQNCHTFQHDAMRHCKLGKEEACSK